MVIVDKNQCRACGLCARICHERCIVIAGENGNRAARIEHALCSTCTQCVAMCPRQALSWDQVPPAPYDKTRLPTPEQLDELFKQRRTIRRFKEERLDRALVEEIVGYGIYAPTNHYHLRAVVVDDPAIMETLDAIMMKHVMWMYNLLYRSNTLFNLIRRITPAVDEKGKVKMEHGLEKGRAFDTLPAAIVFVVGDRRIMLASESAQYALYNMILYAQSKGIGSRINAAGPLSLDRSRTARKRLGLRNKEHILATVELGIPAVKFRNKVEGKRMEIHWNGRGHND
jgi:nitroreductase/NAD-dependent dihydropyrimidine dehydrogenase PreA subunit